MAAARAMFDGITDCVKADPSLKLVILGPAACSIPKIGGKYRCRMLIKCKNSRNLRDMIRDNLAKTEKQFKDVSAFADMNPENII